MGFRLILILVLVVVVIAFLRGLRARDGAARPPAVDAKTVQCAHCAVYLPRNEALVRGGRAFCCEQHAQDADA